MTTSPAADPGGRVTVVMITKDRRDQALTALDRLTELPERPAVIVVDNASTDGTAAAIAARHAAVRVFALARNHGAAGRNVGVAVAATPYVAFSDDDSWWEPGALAAAVAVLDRHHDVALVAGRVLVDDDGRDDPVNRLLADSPLATVPGVPHPRLLGFVACAAVVRRTAFLAAGGFDPDFGVGGEEELLALDLEGLAVHAVHVDHVVARHHPAPRADDGVRRRRQVRNRLWVAWLRLPVAELPGHWWRVARDDGLDRALVGGTLDAVRGWPRVRRRRRVASAEVRALRRALDLGPVAATAVSGRATGAAPGMFNDEDPDAVTFDLVEPDEGMAPDDEATVVARAVDGPGAFDDAPGEPHLVAPEAAAMHIVDEDELLG